MGDTIVSVAALTVPLFTDELKSQKADSMLKTIRHGSDLTTDILKHQAGSLPGKFNRMINFLEDTDEINLPYVWSTRGTAGYGSATEVEDIIEAEILEQVYVSEVKIQVPSAEFVARWFLQENYGYSVSSNVVSNYEDPLDPKWEVTFDDASFRYETDTYFEIEVFFIITDTIGTDPTYTTSKIYDITTFGLDSTVYQAVYNTLANPTELVYWLYDVSDNTYPTIYVPNHAENWETGNEARDFAPFIPLRQFGYTLSESHKPERYEDAKKALDIIDIPYGDIIESLNDNPDIGDVYHAHVGFMIDPADESDAMADYLWHHMKQERLLARNRTTYEIQFLFGSDTYNGFFYDTTSWIADTEYDSDVHYTTSQAARSYYIRMGCAFIEETFHLGTFDKRKEYYVSNTYTADPTGPYAGQTSTAKEFRYLIVRKQLTPSMYSEILVVDPIVIDQVYAPQGGGSVRHLSHTPFWVYGQEPDDQNIRIPLRMSALKSMHNTLDKTYIIQSSMTLLIYGLTVQKLKWYETGVFRGLLIIVAIFLAAVTLQPEIALIATAATLATAAFLTLSLVIEVLIFHLVIDYSVEFLTKEFGLETTFIVIVATAALAATGAGLDAANLLTIPSIETLLGVTVAALGAFTQETVDEIKEIGREQDLFLESAAERQEEIDAASDLLSTKIEYLDLVTKSPIYVDETPTQFFTRTIHTGNIGVTSLDVIHNYVDDSLRLPDTDRIFT